MKKYVLNHTVLWYVHFSVPPTMTRDDVIREEVSEGEDVVLKCPSSNGEIKWKQVCKL